MAMAHAGIFCASVAVRTDFVAFAVSSVLAISLLFCPDLPGTCFAACSYIEPTPCFSYQGLSTLSHYTERGSISALFFLYNFYIMPSRNNASETNFSASSNPEL